MHNASKAYDIVYDNMTNTSLGCAVLLKRVVSKACVLGLGERWEEGDVCFSGCSVLKRILYFRVGSFPIEEKIFYNDHVHLIDAEENLRLNYK